MAALAIAAGADRAGRSVFPYGPFALSSLRSEASTAVELGAGHAAIKPAGDLVAAGPMRVSALSLLGVASAMAGDAVGSDRAMQAASMLGWRDEVAQGWAVRRALLSGKPDMAAQRMEALLRAHPEGGIAPIVLQDVLTDETARTRLAGAMVTNADWPAHLLTQLLAADPDDPVDGLAFVQAAVAQGYRADPALVADAAGRFYRADPAAAFALLVSMSGRGAFASTGLWDGAFAGLSSAQGTRMPFAWNRADGAASILSVIPMPEGKGRLQVHKMAATPEYLAGITTIISPGRFWLSWQANKTHEGDPALSLDAVCARGRSSIEIGSVISRESGFVRPIVVPDGCEAVRVRLFAPTLGPRERWLSEPALRPIG